VNINQNLLQITDFEIFIAFCVPANIIDTSIFDVFLYVSRSFSIARRGDEEEKNGKALE
jgi:hypothetical protein